MIGLIPLIVTGGVVKQFSDGFMGKPKGQKKPKRRTVPRNRTGYSPGRYSPF